MKRENEFQSNLIKDLKIMFPGCMVLKNDPNYIQGIPDLTILYKNKWATLECKRSEEDRRKHPRPNQEHYVTMMNELSYSSFIYPENREEVLNELQHALRP